MNSKLISTCFLISLVLKKAKVVFKSLRNKQLTPKIVIDDDDWIGYIAAGDRKMIVNRLISFSRGSKPNYGIVEKVKMGNDLVDLLLWTQFGHLAINCEDDDVTEMKVVTDYIFDLFDAGIYILNVSDMPRQLIDLFHGKPIEMLSVWDLMIEADHLSYIVSNGKAKHFYTIHWPNNFELNDCHQVNFDSLVVGRAYLMTLEHLIRLNCVEIRMERLWFSNEELNQFLMHWINGGSPRLKCFVADIRNFNQQLALMDINVQETEEQTRIYKSLTTEVEFDNLEIRRNDGAVASIKYFQECGTFVFAVWPDNPDTPNWSNINHRPFSSGKKKGEVEEENRSVLPREIEGALGPWHLHEQSTDSLTGASDPLTICLGRKTQSTANSVEEATSVIRGYDLHSEVFYTISLLRALFCFPGFYCLSAFVAERWFATYFLMDYEKNQRKWLVFLIVWVIYAIAFVSAIDFHNVSKMGDFPLFDLPLVANEHVLSTMNPYQWINLSLTSEESKAAVKRFLKSKPKFKINLGITGEPYIVIFGENEQWDFRWALTEARVGYETNKYGSRVFNNLYKYSENPIEAWMKEYDYIREIIGCELNSVHFQLTSFPRQNKTITDWLSSQPIRCIEIASFDTECDLDLKYVMKNINVTDSAWLSSIEYRRNFQMEIPAIPRICIDKSRFIDFDQLLRLKNQCISLRRSRLDAEEINGFLKSWMACESHFDLETFDIDIPGLEAMEVIMDLPHERTRLPDIAKTFKEKFIRSGVEDGFDIKRSDGKVATVAIGQPWDDYRFFMATH
uniref:FBA_2 domain-containing protein n=1 Tax=Caenorhabditis tropicalis TaxID=1561998 RepID=A0A1I7UX68_9PELO